MKNESLWCVVLCCFHKQQVYKHYQPQIVDFLKHIAKHIWASDLYRFIEISYFVGRSVRLSVRWFVCRSVCLSVGLLVRPSHFTFWWSFRPNSDLNLSKCITCTDLTKYMKIGLFFLIIFLKIYIFSDFSR